MKFGRTPSAPGAVKLKLADYLDLEAFPRVPKTFGHEQKISDYGMLGNNVAGDCVWAGAAHETMIWNSAANRGVPRFSDASVLSDYMAVTGYDPNDPGTDTGTDMATAAQYRQHTGIVDANGQRHKIGAYLALEPGNLAELTAASYLFGAVGIGIVVTDKAMAQFNAGQPWSFRLGGHALGGHYVPVVAKRGGYLVVVTWGKLQKMTWAFYAKCSDEVIAYVSDEYLTNGASPEGFDKAALLRDLAELPRVA